MARSQAPAPAGPLLVLRAQRGWRPLGLRELWQARELIYFLAWRDLKVRYKQTVLGATWAILQPVAGMVVFSVIFGRLVGVPSDDVPYPVFSLAALVPWTFFSNGVTQAANSLVGSRSLITRVYFPRLAVPLASVLAGLVDLAVAFVVLVATLAAFRLIPDARLLALPLFVLLAIVTALGAGLWLAALNVRYRDVRYAVPFLLQFWLFVTPVVYSTTLLPPAWRWVYALNPMTGVVEGFRYALLGTGALSAAVLAVSVAAALIVLVTGVLYFRRVESSFADVI